jgi:TetR/AcrR family transcriptional regulator
MPLTAPSISQGSARAREILGVTIDVFGEVGYAGARIDEVAQRVGIRRPSVLYHFPDKLSLYSAAISDVVTDIVDRVLATEDQPGDRLEAIADTWVDFVIARPNAARLLLRQMIDADPVPIQSTEVPVRELLRSIQSAIDDRADSDFQKPLDATEFVLILSSTSLVWVASRSAVEGALGLDTLSPAAVQRHRRLLHALTRQLIAATSEAIDGSSKQGNSSPALRLEKPSLSSVRESGDDSDGQ